MNRRRPVIGITTDSHDTEDRYLSTITYAAAVERAGGLPLPFPYAVDHSLIPQYVDLLDGICFTGGNDMDPGPLRRSVSTRAAQIETARERNSSRPDRRGRAPKAARTGRLLRLAAHERLPRRLA